MSSQNRVDPFEVWPESGLGGRWPMRWRPATSVEGGTRFWPSGFRVYPILAMVLYVIYRGWINDTLLACYVLWNVGVYVAPGG